jgi:hypothetical protein
MIASVGGRGKRNVGAFPGGHAASQDGREDLVGGGVDGGRWRKRGPTSLSEGPRPHL